MNCYQHLAYTRQDCFAVLYGLVQFCSFVDMMVEESKDG